MEQLLTGCTVMDEQGNEIGKVTDVIADPHTLRPKWVTIRTGRISGEHLVPIDVVETADEGVVTVPFDKDRIKSAPKVSDHTAPSESEWQALASHYQLSAS